MKVLAALSGGVDSAVAAARALDAGHEVTAVHLALSAEPAPARTGARGCCSREDARDAARVADRLGVPFYVWDVAGAFHRDVVEDFVAGYAAGSTPNPCLRCNERIKFAAVWDRGRALGFDRLVTGHYAQRDAGGLRRARDRAKDQSYVLGLLRPEQIAGAWFPIGDTEKAAVRAEARRRGLLVADKPDSHDICFIPDGDTAGFLRRRLGSVPGPVLDRQGRQVGRHDGAYAFTVGQRHGLGLSSPAADGRPRYVLATAPARATVVVGSAAELAVRELTTDTGVWSRELRPPLSCQVQLRAHAAPLGASVRPDGDGLLVRLDTPTRGVAPGQAAVFYHGDAVLGGARVTTPVATG